MKIPASNYTLDSFCDYLAEHSSEILTEDEGRWLKAYLLYVRRDWKSLFAEYGLERMGSIWRFEIPDEPDQGRLVTYHAYEWREGLLLCFTGSTKEDYEKTLQRFAKENRGVSRAWIPPSVFDTLKNYMLDERGATMYRFISKRSRFSEVEAKIGRPEYNRRLSYSGEDSSQVLKETQTMYGTLATSMDFRLDGNKIHLNKEGLIITRDVNPDTLELLRKLVDMAGHELATVRETSEKFKVSSQKIGELDHQITVPMITAGKITTPHAKFDVEKVKLLFGESRDEPALGKGEEEISDFQFSFIDTYVSEDATSFSATVVDDEKGTVFGMSANNGEMVLIPKHRTTFESFVRFYESIVEDFDVTASLATFSEPVIAR